MSFLIVKSGHAFSLEIDFIFSNVDKMTAYHGGKQRLGKQLAEVIVGRSKDIAEEEGFEINGGCWEFIDIYQSCLEKKDATNWTT
jgi:hypothetical protein